MLSLSSSSLSHSSSRQVIIAIIIICLAPTADRASPSLLVHFDAGVQALSDGGTSCVIVLRRRGVPSRPLCEVLARRAWGPDARRVRAYSGADEDERVLCNWATNATNTQSRNFRALPRRTLCHNLVRMRDDTQTQSKQGIGKGEGA